VTQGYAAQDFLEGMEGFEALGQGERARDDLRLCAICMQWACSNPQCRSQSQCDLQVQLNQLEPREVLANA
jgi:hypothetical protein